MKHVTNVMMSHDFVWSAFEVKCNDCVYRLIRLMYTSRRHILCGFRKTFAAVYSFRAGIQTSNQVKSNLKLDSSVMNKVVSSYAATFLGVLIPSPLTAESQFLTYHCRYR
jgi:hypothetical protein